jgi:hypothetical protein
MVFTLLGMTMDVRLVQPWKVFLPIALMLFGKLTEVRLLQLIKVPIISLTELGIETDVIFVWFWNVPRKEVTM